MSTEDTTHQVRRRTGGRSARVRDAVLDAALQTMSDLATADITIKEIARRSGVHATSIQRRWGTKENVLLDAVLSLSRTQLPIPDAGSLRADMICLSRNIASYYSHPTGRTVMRTLAAGDDDAAMAASRNQLVEARFDAALAIFRRAQGRGELRPDADPQTALEVLIGPLHYRALVSRYPLDDAFIESVVDMVLRGVGAIGVVE